MNRRELIMKTRNYEQIISDFDKMFAGDRRYPIYCSDLENIRNNNADLFHIIESAIKYGYMLGYKAGKRK